ncbi:MAG TPA: SRPBCC family protein [Chitinophagaceae bacterium]|nr:SRPBCC family protein [Chitinophagaceae bacterium]
MKNNISLEVGDNILAPASKVWEALTDPALIKQYFFDTDTYTNWKPGSPIVFKGEWKGQHYEDKGTVLDVVEDKLLRYSYWSAMSGIEDEPENYLIVTYELEEKENATKLTIRQENIPDEKMKIHSADNWRKVMTGLKKLVESREKEKIRSF